MESLIKQESVIADFLGSIKTFYVCRSEVNRSKFVIFYEKSGVGYDNGYIKILLTYFDKVGKTNDLKSFVKSRFKLEGDKLSYVPFESFKENEDCDRFFKCFIDKDEVDGVQATYHRLVKSMAMTYLECDEEKLIFSIYNF